jgi:hypothetical protein
LESRIATRIGADYFKSVTPDSDQALDYLEQQIPNLSAAAVDVAYWQALAAGQTVLISEEGGLFQVFPDGKKQLIKPTAPPVSVPIGTRVRIP